MADETIEVETMEEYQEAIMAQCDGVPIQGQHSDPSMAQISKEGIQLDFINQLKTQGLLEPSVDAQLLVSNLCAPPPFQCNLVLAPYI